MRIKRGKIKRAAIIALCLAMITGIMGCAKEKTALDPKNPVTVTIWNYYNGDQLAAFEQLVEQFNSTVGNEKGIVAVNVSQGDINSLADSLIASVEKKAGSQEIPTMAAVYSETAYILDKAGALVAMDEYFTEKELSAYIPGFLEEGRFNENNELLLFPILKSTELFTANETDWEPFAQETGITPQSIKTHEDLCKAAKTYYEWTDAMTPNIKEDGKALYGRDSVANYIFIGCYQLGHEIFKVEDGVMTLDMDKDTMRTLWDNYYIPYINGYFGAYARFRSEDCKMGKILALTSSSSSVGYLPTAVTDINDTTHDISTYITRALPFEGTVTEAIVQQGASYCLLKSTPAAQEGAVEFIKWFTAYERNLDFAMMSGYSPVTIEANTAQAINSSFNQDATTPKGKNVLGALITGAEAFSECDAYATKPFNGSKEVRIILGDALEQKAAEDRRQVISLMEAGQTRQQAVSNFITDENFNTWFEELCLKVNETVK